MSASVANIQSLRAVSFRNYESVSLEFSSRHNLLIGSNGVGKSNVLEAINLISTTRSFRGAKDKDMIKFGAESAVIRGAAGQSSYEIRIPARGRRTVSLNGTTLPKVSDLLGRLPSVCFSTADMEIIRGDGSDRRRFLDLELCQASVKYLVSHATYTSALRHRNALLKDIKHGSATRDQLQPWDQKLAESCASVRNMRLNYISELAPICAEYHLSLTDGAETMQTKYIQNDEGCDAGSIIELLSNQQSADLAAGHTTVGAHRDELEIRVNQDHAKPYSSQGQQRTSVLSLKLAQLRWWRDRMGVMPILLLDDIFSDLDEKRRSRVLSVSGEVGQVVITATDANSAHIDELITPAVFTMKSGEWVSQ